MEPGELIRAIRRDSGVTQDQLAVRAATTKTAISRLESGAISPSARTLQRLLISLGCELRLGAEPLEPSIDASQLTAVAQLTPTERLDHGIASLGSLSTLVGAAHDE